MGEREVMKVQLMNKFQLTYHSNTLDEESIHSSKGVKLLVFLLLHRKKPVSVQELYELFGSGERSAKNPYGFLKNLVYRMRNLLKQLGPEEFIISTYKGYGWNPEIPVQIDVENFENLCKKVKKSTVGGVKSDGKKHEEAVKAFHGPLTEVLSDEHWVISISVYYTSLYLEIVKELVTIYDREAEYEKLVNLCRSAIQYEFLDEDLNYWLIKGLIGLRKPEEALGQYKQAAKTYQDELGDRKLEKIRPLYEELMAVMETEAEPLEKILQQIDNGAGKKGACFCDKGIFLHICGIESRRKQRSRGEDSLLLMTLTVEGLESKEGLEEFLLKQGRKKLRNVISSSLRVGDVVTEYSTRQFAMLLASCGREDSKKVAQRLIKNFEQVYKGRHISISYEMEELN